MENIKIFEEFLNESTNGDKTAAPINHKIEDDKLILMFTTPEECQAAKQYYSDMHVRTSNDKLSLIIPVISAIRYIVNSHQNQAYNPR